MYYSAMHVTVATQQLFFTNTIKSLLAQEFPHERLPTKVSSVLARSSEIEIFFRHNIQGLAPNFKSLKQKTSSYANEDSCFLIG